jgi:hypothetical protein
LTQILVNWLYLLQQRPFFEFLMVKNLLEDFMIFFRQKILERIVHKFVFLEIKIQFSIERDVIVQMIWKLSVLVL